MPLMIMNVGDATIPIMVNTEREASCGGKNVYAKCDRSTKNIALPRATSTNWKRSDVESCRREDECGNPAMPGK